MGDSLDNTTDPIQGQSLEVSPQPVGTEVVQHEGDGEVDQGGVTEEQPVDQKENLDNTIIQVSEWTGVVSTLLEQIIEAFGGELDPEVAKALNQNVSRFKGFHKALGRLAHGSDMVVVFMGCKRIYQCMMKDDHLGAAQAVGDTGLHALTMSNPFNPDAGSENRSVRTFGHSFIDLERVQIDRPAALQ